MTGGVYEIVDARLREDAARLGLWVFLAGETLFFGVPCVAYAVARLRAPEAFAAAASHTDLFLGTLNTALLLTSSGAVALASEAAARGRSRWVASGFSVAALLGLAFIVVKGLEWSREWHEGLFPGPGFTAAGGGPAELFWAWYFLVTAMHAVHLAVGVCLTARFAWGAHRGNPRCVAAPRVEGVGLYWHFVDVVWIVLYPLIYLVGTRA